MKIGGEDPGYVILRLAMYIQLNIDRSVLIAFPMTVPVG